MTTTTTSTTNPAIARTVKEQASPRQQSAIVSIARSKGLNGHRVCEQVYKCEIHELTSLAASALIDALKSVRAGEMAKAQTSRDLMEYENAVDAGTFTGSYGEWVELY
jgi:hypothetical protein